MPSKKGAGLEQPDQEDIELERSLRNDFPQFTAHHGDVRALGAFRREFIRPNRYEHLNIFVLAHEGDVSADRVFAEDEENNVVFYSTSKGVERALEARGHEAKKSNLERRTESERADVFIMLDPNVRVTKRLLENVAPGGWILCRLAAANSMRARGKYVFKGTIEKKGENASLSRREDPKFWKSVEVDSDKSFQGASNPDAEDVVAYEEAREKVRAAGMSEHDVFKSYSKLIEMAEEQNLEAVARGETLLKCTLTVDGKEKEITVNTALPAKQGEHDDLIIVMRKNLVA